MKLQWTSNDPLTMFQGTAILSNRISYIFDLRGPSVTLDTACSSGLVALNQACMAIRDGEATQALVGGVNLILDPDQVTVMSSMS
jgi:acyl transferase domain-containing protein